MEKRNASCVLCRTCANWAGRAAQERRRGQRVCRAGIAPSELFHCESYVRRGLLRPAEPRHGRDSHAE